VRKVETAGQLIEESVTLLADPAGRAVLANAAREWGEANRGATERTLAVVRGLLREPEPRTRETAKLIN
jgi:3-deoxy-D-manno-octulosonic-acid transferase